MLNSIVTSIVLLICFGSTLVCESLAQVTINRLPKDGAWARYEMVSKQQMPAFGEGDEVGEEMITKGEITIRSVGTEYIEMEAHRWIEIETRVQRPAMLGERGEIVTIVKMLVPEIEFSLEKPFPGKVKKIIVFNNGLDSETTEELDPGSQNGKQAVEMLTQQNRMNSKQIEDKEITTDIGTFQCKVTQYSGLKNVGDSGESKSEGGDEKVDAVDGEKEDGDVVDEADMLLPDNFEMSYVIYTSEKASFGLIKATVEIGQVIDGKKTPFGNAEISLKATGTNAKSAMPDKMP